MIMVLFLFSCKEKNSLEGLQMPNPASVNCHNKGGKLKILNSSDGQYGICIFKDWTICEEWSYFRNECKPGDCEMRCLKKKGKTAWYDCKGAFLFFDQCIAEPKID